MRSKRSLACALAVLVAAACGGDDPGGPTASTPAEDASPPPSPAPGAGCEPAVPDLAVARQDLDGYPPYAIAGCELVYVAESGALVARDLSGGDESELAPATERPRRPSMSANVVAWEADQGGASVVRVLGGGVARTVEGPFAAAGEPRVSGATVVFTAWASADPDSDSDSDSDVWTYDAETGEARLAMGGPGQQRWADVSDAFVVATDFGEDPDGRFDDDERDVADIGVLRRADGALSRRTAPGKQAFPMLASGDRLAYLDWGAIHPEPKLQAYQLRSGEVLGAPASDRTLADVRHATPAAVRPAVAGGAVEWIANPDGVTTLWSAPVDGSSAPAKVDGLDGLRLFAPVAWSGSAGSSGSSSGVTLVAVADLADPGARPRLRALLRSP
jgi:hypothetical protein